MFPLLITALRNAAIRYGDLALRLLTLETVRLPDHLFAPTPRVVTCLPPTTRPAIAHTRPAIAHTRPAERRPAAPARAGAGSRRPSEARVREARRRLADRPPHPCAHANGERTTQLHRYAARRGAAAADGRLTGSGTPAGRGRP